MTLELSGWKSQGLGKSGFSRTVRMEACWSGRREQVDEEAEVESRTSLAEFCHKGEQGCGEVGEAQGVLGVFFFKMSGIQA